MWQKQICLLEKFFLNISVHDLYIFLIARRSTELQLNAYKTMSDSLQYVKWDWVSALSGIQLPNNNVLVKASVHYSQSLKKKEVTLWFAIHTNKSIIAAHCPCTAGQENCNEKVANMHVTPYFKSFRLGNVCCHVGALMYGIMVTVLSTHQKGRKSTG